MYSRNTRNTNEEGAYPFSLPERYGGSRFRRVRETETKVHIPSTAIPPPVHRSVPQEPFFSSAEEPPTRTDPTEKTAPPENTPDADICSDDSREEKENAMQSPDPAEAAEAPRTAPVSATKEAERSPAPSFLSTLSFEDLLLTGLILLLSREKESHDNNDIMLLLSLLLAYRP